MRISDWSSDVCSSDLLDQFSQVADASEEAKRILQAAHEARDRMGTQAKKDYDELIAQGKTERDEVQRQTRDRRVRIEQLLKDRSDERRDGTESVSTCSCRWVP